MRRNRPHPSGLLPRFTRLARLAFVAALVVIGMSSSLARADDTIKHPGAHPAYNFEVEPHLLLGWDNVYANDGYGLGVRFSIPIVDNGFVSTINNSVAISFGLDLVHYDGCWYRGDCQANYIHLPVAMQWNFYVASRWSVFGEPGLVIYHGFFNDCPPDVGCPGRPRVTSIEPALYLGGRYHFNDKMSLTMRLGFPSISVGISFFP
jgi:hypothetical protein